MAYWNIRVVKQYIKGELYYGIHEAYYNVNNVGNISITADPVEISAESLPDLVKYLKLIIKGLGRPVLDYETQKPLEEEVSLYRWKNTLNGSEIDTFQKALELAEELGYKYIVWEKALYTKKGKFLGRDNYQLI